MLKAYKIWILRFAKRASYFASFLSQWPRQSLIFKKVTQLFCWYLSSHFHSAGHKCQDFLEGCLIKYEPLIIRVPVLYHYPYLHSKCFNLTKQPKSFRLIVLYRLMPTRRPPALLYQHTSLLSQPLCRRRLGINEIRAMSSAKKEVWLMSDCIFSQPLSPYYLWPCLSLQQPLTPLADVWLTCWSLPSAQMYCGSCGDSPALCSHFLGSVSVLWKLECQELHF